jgi:hypothetical protein
MHRVAAGRDRGGDHRVDPQVALARRGRADADGLVGEPDVRGAGLGGRVDRDRLDPELVERPDHAERDLSPVGDEHAPEH